MCPHCGKGVRFDAMKAHLDCCEEPVSLTKPQQGSPAKNSMPAAAGKPASGVDYYHRLNKLSCLSRPSRSTSDCGENRSSASPVREDAAVTQQLMYSSSSLTVDLAASRFRASVPSREHAAAKPRRRLSPSSVANPNASGGAASLSTTPPSPPPSIKVNLRSTSRETDATSRVAGVGLHSASGVRSYRRPQSAEPLTASSAAVARSASSKPHSTTEHIASTAARGHRDAAHRRSCGTTRETESLRRHPANSVRAAPPGAHTDTLDGVSAAAEDSALPSTIAELSCAHSAAPTAMSTKRAHETSIAASSAASAVSSVMSSKRPTPQLSSFAIRLRGAKGFSSSAQRTAESDSCVPSMRLHDSDAVGNTQQPIGDMCAASSLGSAPTAMTQLKTSLSQMQRLVRLQQEQLSALLRAHGDLQRQVTAQHGAYNEIVQRSMSQGAEMEAALQKHTAQWRREQVAMQESVAALWDIVSDVHQPLHVKTRFPAKILAASHQAEESAYYSDIASFIQPDVTAPSFLAASLLLRKDGPLPSAQASVSAFANGSRHPCAPSSPGAMSFASAVLGPSATAVRAAPYKMDIQQQQEHRESMEDRVVAMLHRKPTVVVRHSAWRQQ